MQSLDIAVCGCGPAGLAAATLLQRAGHRVRIFERFETPQPVGSGLILQPTGLGVLAELGVVRDVMSLGARIDRLFGRVLPSNRVVLDVRYSAIGSGWHGVAVHRAALFDVLYRAAVAANVEIVPGTEIDAINRSKARVELLAKSDLRLGSFDLVVDALGARSPLAKGIARRTVLPFGALWANIPFPSKASFAGNALEQRYFRASRMAGILPIGKRDVSGSALAAFFWSLECDQVKAWRSRPLSHWKQEVERLWPAAAEALESLVDHDQVVFAQYDHFTARTPYADRLVHIGDAAHSTSPQLGQGANMAMLDALALAKALQGSGTLEERLHGYARMRYWHIRLFQAASAIFTPFYQSHGRVLPIVRDWLASPLSRLPIGDAILARLVCGMTVPPLMRNKFKAYRHEGVSLDAQGSSS